MSKYSRIIKTCNVKLNMCLTVVKKTIKMVLKSLFKNMLMYIKLIFSVFILVIITVWMMVTRQRGKQAGGAVAGRSKRNNIIVEDENKCDRVQVVEEKINEAMVADFFGLEYEDQPFEDRYYYVNTLDYITFMRGLTAIATWPTNKPIYLPYPGQTYTETLPTDAVTLSQETYPTGTRNRSTSSSRTSTGTKISMKSTAASTPSTTTLSPKQKYLLKICGRGWIPSGRLMGDVRPLSPHGFPWMARIAYADRLNDLFRMGAIITERFVLTAVNRSELKLAPGFQNIQGWLAMSEMRVIVGEHLRSNRKGVILKISSFYDSADTEIYFLRLIRLESKIRLSNYALPICLPFSPDMIWRQFVGKNAYVAGFENNGQATNSMVRSRFLVINDTQCVKKYPKKRYDTMCAERLQPRTANCDKEIGGPLMVRRKNIWYLAGVVVNSFCNSKFYYPVHAIRTNKHLDWIMKTANIVSKGESVLIDEDPDEPK